MSSLLVRDGLVGVKRMEKAFQRQVIYGGSLDTILLEMNLVPEERLTQYLALASGLPPAARDDNGAITVDATTAFNRDVAERYRAVPIAIEGEAVRVLVCSPLELADLEDLADLVDRPLQPLITPEYRWHLAFARAYQLEPPARFTTLARTLEVDASPTPVGRAKSVIVDEVHPTFETLTPTPPAGRVVDPPVVTTPRQPRAGSESERTRSNTLIGVAAKPIRSRHDSLPDHIAKPMIVFNTPANTAPMPAVTPRPRPTSRLGLPRPASSPISSEGRDAPLPVARARELLATSDDRDTVFLTLLRAARSRARWAGLLTVQGGAAIGRVALGEPGLDTEALNTVLIPLDVVSPYRTVVTSHQPHVGALVSGDPGVDAMSLRLGGTMPPSALILPIVLRERVVAVVVAHRVHSDLRLADVTELLPLANAAADALGRLIVKHKAAGYRAPNETPVVEIEAEQIDTKKIVRSPQSWSVPDRAPSPTNLEVEIERVIEPSIPIDEVLNAIETAREGFAEEMLADAVSRPSESIGALARRFPGKLRIERFTVAGRPLRAAQYGGLLELVIRLGPVASELLIDRMSAPQRDVRFYATVCAAELRPRNAVFALVERVFDQDFGVRASAIEALSGYPIQDLGHALSRARRAVHSSDPEVVAAATAAIVTLGDVEAIADLIGVIEREDRAGEHARRALMALTAQDFGPSEKKWRRWYEVARHRHRIEWLIEGLHHKEDAIREASINDLRRLTGEYFGYHHDLPKRERELAADRWAAWWRESGQRRFVLREDERHRPTAQLPVRRD